MTTAKQNEDGLDKGDLEFAAFHEDYLSRYIQLADAKAGTALVTITAVLGFLLGDNSLVAALTCLDIWWKSLLAIATVAALGISGAFAFHVILPRQPSGGDGLIFWGDVARRSQRDFIDAVHAAGIDGIAKERLAHSHVLTGVCRAKYLWLRRSMMLGAVGLLGAFLCRALI